MVRKTIVPLALIIISLAGITVSLDLIKSSRDVRQLAQTAASPSSLPLPALKNIPSLTANAPPGAEYTITSDNNNVKVVLDKKYGGAITKLYDYTNSGNNNIVNNSQAGAMFQTAFWLEPIQNFNPPYVGNNPRLAPFCSENDTSMWWNNPTQAGFDGGGWSGNPIGIMGTNESVPDPKEFIQYENSGKTVHLKSRFINFGFCFEGIGAPMREPNCDALSPTGECKYFWDTGFYIEQWVSFHPKYPRVLQISSKITFEESKTYEQDPNQGFRRLMSSRQLPVYFAYRLPRGVYFKDGLQIKLPPFGETFNPDYKWMALIQKTLEAGVGYVPPKNTVQMTPPPYPLGFSSLTHDGPDGDYVTVMANNNVPDLTTMGKLNNVTRYQDTVFFQFNPTGSFEWTSFFPVGMLPDIFWQAEAVQSTESFSQEIGGFIDRFSCDLPDIAGWVRDKRTSTDLTVKVEIAPINNPVNLITRTGVAGNYRSDLTTVCPPDGKCAFSVKIGTLPASFKDKKLKVKVYGVAPDGTSRNIVYHTISNIIGPCNNLLPPPSFTIEDLKNLIKAYLGINDDSYYPQEGKINMWDAGWVRKWLNP